MITYGWTLDQTLDITLPQANLLFKAMGNLPAPAVALAAMMDAFKETQGDVSISSLAGVASNDIGPDTQKFLKKIGIESGG